ncbi:MAG: DUF192 domain-containing protein [Candidatus Omnitrophica bacterium]|nr:DUF192 domain-containing protein [Candidatus Omnitrophota bacterium]
MLFNQSQNSLIVSRLEIADTFFSRANGLLGRNQISSDEGLLITRCNSIHMFFMKFSIDAVFLDKKNQVVGLVENIGPFQVSPVFWKADKVIELSAGSISIKKIILGNILCYSNKCPNTSLDNKK